MQPIWKKLFMGMKIIVSDLAYTEKRTWRVVAIVTDRRRPNKVKPIFKRKLLIERTPTVYMVAGQGLIIHPELYAKLQKKMADSIEKETRRAVRSALGIPEQMPKPPTLTIDEFTKLTQYDWGSHKFDDDKQGDPNGYSNQS